MATKIPKEMLSHVIRTAPRSDYNWEQYDDGDWWQLRQGDDYTTRTVSARGSAAAWAKAHGKRAETAALKDHDGFALRFVSD